ncbi:hypothetical protein AMS59_15945 [Lysinibacillus sp. FJAT-14745]|uniref:DUF4085 family protein n=1 Tax=Lysinibacillus sp. FJAT-14745 TaxID=1704289 RepID=UPI0006ABD9EF|nr:DUF4085 family protein [Lysinibacillus sp. FJAT-14745]KOP72422.1 hypothetical protein AMS59_15945 [Lysinibacillus sp. FJAT-14745]
MWHLTLQEKKAYESAMKLFIYESDEEWTQSLAYAKENDFDLYKEKKQELDELRDSLMNYLPLRFQPYVLDGTLNTPEVSKHVREDFLRWRNEQEQLFENILDAAFEEKQKTLAYMKPMEREVFEQSLHDAKIVSIRRNTTQVELTFDMAGGFTAKSIISLTFNNVISEVGQVELEQFYIYDELRKTANGIALRVIFDCPEVEWTIEAEELDAEFYYRSKTYNDFAENGNFSAYIQTLQLENGLIFITPQLKKQVVGLQQQAPFLIFENSYLYENEHGVFVDSIRVADKLDDCIHFLHTETYEDPYAHFSEPVPVQDLEEAALGTDLELKVRAWNTMYANPVQLAEKINDILMQMNPGQEDDMMQRVFIRHFNKEGILTTKLQAKFKDILTE